MAEHKQVNSLARGSVVAVVGGVLLMLGGGVLIAMAWNGAASLDYLQGQFPYLLSGSLPGLALVVLGGSVLVLNALRRDAAERSRQMQRLIAAIDEVSVLLGPQDPYEPGTTGEYRPRPRDRSSASIPAGAEGGR